MSTIFNSLQSEQFVRGSGINHRIAVRLSTTQNTNWTTSASLSFLYPTLTISGLSSGVLLGLIDSVEPSIDDRILIKDAGYAFSGISNTAAFNGIWVVSGGTTTSLTLIRAEDLTDDDNPLNTFCNVLEGSVCAKSSFVCTSVSGTGIIDDNITLLNYTQSALFNYSAGDIVYADSTNTLTTLSSPSQPSLLSSNTPGSISWVNQNEFMIRPKHMVPVQQNSAPGVFTSIATAIAAIPVFPDPDTPSSTNQWTVYIYPGTYYEPAITIPSWVYIIGIEMESVTIKPSGLGYSLFTFQPNSGLNFVSIDTTDPNYPACQLVDIEDFCLMHKVSFNNCAKAISCLTTNSATQQSQLYLEYVDMTDSGTYSLLCQDTNPPGNYGSFVSIENYFTFGHSDDTIIIDGPNTQLFAHATELHGDGTGNGLRIIHGGEINVRSMAIYQYNNGALVDSPTSTMISILSNGQILPQATINVTSTSGFLNSGSLLIAGETITYTGITPTSFTGCTGGTSTMFTGENVSDILDPIILTTGIIYTQCSTNINVQNIYTQGHADGYTEYLKTIVPSAAPFFITGQDQRIITVGYKGKNFNLSEYGVGTIAAALASITDNSTLNRYTIQVGPGIYPEPPLQMKPYVNVVGIDFQTSTVIMATDSTQPLIYGSPNSVIQKVTLTGANPAFPPGVYPPYLIEYLGNLSGNNFWVDNIIFNTAVGLIHVGSTNGPTIQLITNCLISMETQFTNGILIEDSGPSNYPIAYIIDNLIWNPNLVGLTNFSNLLTVKSYLSPAPIQNVFGAFTNSSIGQTLTTSGTGIDLEGAIFSILETCILGGFTTGYIVNTSVETTHIVIASSTFNNNSTDLNIISPNVMGNITVNADQSSCFINDNVDVGVIINDPNGNIVLTGVLNIGNKWSRITDFSDQLQHASDTGSVDFLPSLTPIGGLTVSVSGGQGYTFLGPPGDNYLWQTKWSANPSLSLPNNQFTWIYVDSTGTILTAPSRPSDIQNVILGTALTYSGGISYTQEIGPLINNKATVIDDMLANVLGPISDGGCIASAGSSLVSRAVQVTAGSYYVGSVGYNATFNDNITMLGFYNNGAIEVSLTSVPLLWDNSGVLTAITPGMWIKHSLYVLANATTGTQYLFVYGQQEYASQLAAQQAALAIDPPFFTGNICPISAIIVTNTDPNSPLASDRFQDIRPTLAFRAASATAPANHSSLLGLTVGDDHPQYFRDDGTHIMTGNLNLGTVNIFGSGYPCSFTASITGTTLNVTSIVSGAIAVNQIIYALGVTKGTTITAFGSGSGGIGTYVVTPSQTVVNEVMNSFGGNLYNNMDPTFHNARHLPGGPDGLPTDVPVNISTVNQIGSAASFARSDHVHALPTTGVVASTYGSSTQVPQIAIDAYGRATSISNVAISGVPPGGPAGGVLSGTYPNPSIAAGAVTNSMLQNSTFTVVAGTGLSTGGTASLGGSVTLALSTPVSTTNGGTGLNTSGASNGQLLIGNGAGLSLSTITAGSNINITNGPGSITIAATGTGTSSPITFTLSTSQITVNSVIQTTVAYFPWKNSRYSVFATRTVRAWVVPGSSKDLIISVVNNGGATLGSLTVLGGSATGEYEFTFSAPGADTRLDLAVVRLSGISTDPVIYGITMEFA
jgi:hypothetical protein